MSDINFRKQVGGFNITEHGVRSFTKPIRIGPINLTFNANPQGIAMSVGLRGTGIYKHGIELISFNGKNRKRRKWETDQT